MTNCSKGAECKSVCVLSKILADTYSLLLKTQNVHWNVQSCNFWDIHMMTDAHYNDLFGAIDVIAERIRMVGGTAPATFSEFASLSSFDEKITPGADGKGMLQELLKAHEAICKDLRDGLASIAELNDHGTADVLGSRLSFHEKVVWMLKASLG
ncbi:MAG: DNA starvation/stationary phase protection protein [Alphaproteobacteria bacterium]|nr:DNA starvation/stationary phase protection protein [Alphaproteobacteria bacterium]